MGDTWVSQRKLYLAGRDLSGDQTAMALMFGRDPIEFTKGQDTTHLFKSGLKNVSLEAEGVVNLGDNLAEDILAASIDLNDQPIIICPTTGLDGEPAYGFRANVGEYSHGGSVGERLDFKVSARAYTSKLVRGKIIADAAAARAATFNGTARQLGAVSATQKLYACLMVLAASGVGQTLDGTIQSDNAVGFPSAATVATFTQKTATGDYEWVEVPGAITDDWFRFRGVIGGAGPSFTIVVLLAVL